MRQRKWALNITIGVPNTVCDFAIVRFIEPYGRLSINLFRAGSRNKRLPVQD